MNFKKIRTMLVLAVITLLAPLSTTAFAQEHKWVSFGFGQKAISVSSFQNIYEKNLETQRFIASDLGPVMVSFVGVNHSKPDALAIATLPLRFHFGRFHAEGGGWVGTQRIPSFGTYANFAARLQLDLSHNLQLSWLHLSNASIGENNPATDAIGLTWRLK